MSIADAFRALGPLGPNADPNQRRCADAAALLVFEELQRLSRRLRAVREDQREDLAAKVFVKLYEKGSDAAFRAKYGAMSDDGTRGFLWTVLKNAAKDFHKAKANQDQEISPDVLENDKALPVHCHTIDADPGLAMDWQRLVDLVQEAPRITAARKRAFADQLQRLHGGYTWEDFALRLCPACTDGRLHFRCPPCGDAATPTVECPRCPTCGAELVGDCDRCPTHDSPLPTESDQIRLLSNSLKQSASRARADAESLITTRAACGGMNDLDAESFLQMLRMLK